MRSDDISKKTGLSRDQIRYCEEKTLCGPVKRDASNARDFTEAQFQFFVRLAALREGGISLEEAAALAAEPLDSAVPRVTDERLQVLLARSDRELERAGRKTLLLIKLERKRRQRGAVPPNECQGCPKVALWQRG